MGNNSSKGAREALAEWRYEYEPLNLGFIAQKAINNSLNVDVVLPEKPKIIGPRDTQVARNPGCWFCKHWFSLSRLVKQHEDIESFELERCHEPIPGSIAELEGVVIDGVEGPNDAVGLSLDIDEGNESDWKDISDEDENVAGTGGRSSITLDAPSERVEHLSFTNPQRPEKTSFLADFGQYCCSRKSNLRHCLTLTEDEGKGQRERKA